MQTSESKRRHDLREVLRQQGFKSVGEKKRRKQGIHVGARHALDALGFLPSSQLARCDHV